MATNTLRSQAVGNSQRSQKPPKLPKVKGAPNKHLHARTTFLYQAATYLTLQAASGSTKSHGSDIETTNFTSSRGIQPTEQSLSPLALQLGTHLRAVSLKGQVRLSTNLKRSLCKTCNAVLIPGHTSTHLMENESNSNKPCADVLVVGCSFCGSKKRFPVGAKRQERKYKRGLIAGDASPGKTSVEIDQSTTPAILTSTGNTPSST